MEAFLVGGQRIFAGRRTSKGVTGYDVTALLVGSEGTLAVFGDVTLALTPKPQSVTTLLALFSDLAHAGASVESMVAAGLVPRCIELLDGLTLDAMRRAGNAIDARADAMLLIEVDGDEASIDAQAERVGEACTASSALDVLVAQDAAQRERLWAARREMSHAVRRLAKNKLSEDVVVPRQKIGALLARVREFCERERVLHLTYGHAGDGNLHVNFLWNEPSEIPAVERAIEALFREVIALGGTLSGEHGIGVLKAPYLPLEQSAELIALQKDIKRTFDPQGLLNPGKIFPVGLAQGVLSRDARVDGPPLASRPARPERAARVSEPERRRLRGARRHRRRSLDRSACSPRTSRGFSPGTARDFRPCGGAPIRARVMDPEQLHVSRSLARELRRGRFRVTFDRAFEAVMIECGRERDDGTWITDDMLAAYVELHRRGHAHSFEVWNGERLVGGLYGVHRGALFAAESMFHRETNASKVALVVERRDVSSPPASSSSTSNS